MKTTLIIYNQMNTGGIETLILRFAKYVKARGNTLHVLLTVGGGSLMNELRKVAEVRIAKPFPLTLNPDTIHSDLFYTQCQELFVLCPEGNPLGLKIAQILDLPYKVGIFHPEDYGLLTSRFYKQLFDAIPDGCKLFMNEDCLTNHERILKRKINGAIWPLPVITKKTLDNSNTPKPKKNRIISIGRFDPFKTYNLTTIQAIANLRAKGIDLQYDLYGYGLLEGQMRTLIRTLQLEDRVFLKGILKYEDLEKTVREAYVFVGCGTAAIEAAHAGVPTIIATLETDGLSNGLFTDPIGYNIGEKSTLLQTQKIERLIEQILNLHEDEYNQLSALHTLVAEERYEAVSVFDSYFKLPEIYIHLKGKLKKRFVRASVYFLAYNSYKWGTKTFGLQHLKKVVKNTFKA